MTKTIYTNAAELVCALRAAALAAPSASCLAEWGKWEESAKKTNTAHGLAALYGDNGPSFADWKAGKPWAQVAHGSAGHDRYDDNYGWLSHVRRHANGK